MTIDEDKLREAFALLTARVAFLERHLQLFASDEDLDGPKGDPTARFNPKRWQGDDFKGRRYSQCTPDFLDVLAETLTWMADNPQPQKEKFVAGNRLDAARARSWARRLRAGGWAPPPKPERGAGRPGAATRPTSGRPERAARPTRGGRPAAVQEPAQPLAEAPREEARPNSPADVGFDDEPRDLAPPADSEDDLFGPEDDEGDLGDDFLDEGAAL